MARISEEELEQLKRSVDLAALVRSKGIELKKHGSKDLCGLSPFTDEKTPSFIVTPDKNLWHCMSSGKGGSVIDFVMQYDGVSFREAVELLRTKSPQLYKSAKPVKVSTIPKLPPPVAFDADDQTLFKQVLDYYAERLKENPSALDYLKKRGLVSEEALKTFRIGYADRTLGLTLPHKNRKDGAEIRARLQKLGLYRDTGREHFNGCLVFPICDENGLVQEVYGRKANEKQANKVYHLYLPGPHRGIWNPCCLKYPEIILTESVIDALTFWVNGFRNVTCIYGTEGFTDDHLEAFKANQTQRIYLAYDRDKAGGRATERDAERLQSYGIECFRVKFPPGMDANEYALKVTPAKKSLQALITGAEWLGKGQAVESKIEDSKSHDNSHVPSSNNLLAAKLAADRFVDEARQRGDGAPQACPKGEESRVPSGRDDEQLAAKERRDAVPTSVGTNVSCSDAGTAKDVPSPKGDKTGLDDGREPDQQKAAKNKKGVTVVQSGEDYLIDIIDRQYRVRGLHKNSSFEVLKVNLRLWHNERFYLDTLDLYRAKERAHYINAAASETNLETELIKRDLGRVLLALESLQEARLKEALEPAEPTVEISPEDREAAFDLLKSENLLERILEDFAACGIVGEATNKLTGYLAAVSRKLDKPLAIIVQSTSAAGKTALMESVLAMMPEEERVKYSAMTGQSLYYLGETNLKNKILAIVEEEGAEKASYALKLLQSEGEFDGDTETEEPQLIGLIDTEKLNYDTEFTGQTEEFAASKRGQNGGFTKASLAAETSKKATSGNNSHNGFENAQAAHELTVTVS